MILAKNILGMGLGLAITGAFGYNGVRWYDLKEKKGVTIQDVLYSYYAEKAAMQSEKNIDLTEALLSGPEYWELREKEDPRLMRWLNQVQPRLENHQGQLDIYNQGLDEMAKLYPVGGPLPPMQGNWVPLGPRAAGTAGAGRLNSIDFHPTNENSYAVSTPGGGVWITTDAGVSWTTTTDFLPNSCFQWATWDPTNVNTLYIGGGDGDATDCNGIGVLKSVDAGKTWKVTGATMTWTPSQGRKVGKLAMLPNGTLIVGSTMGIHTSSDGGVTYKLASGISGRVWDLEVKPGSNTTVYASTATAFYRSDDGGLTFSTVSGVPNSTNRVYISVSNSNPELVIALTSTRSTFNGIWKSTNSGVSFTSIGTGSYASCSQAWYDIGFSVSHANADEMALGCLSNYRSTNAGTSGTTLSGSHVDIHGLYYHPKTGALFSVNDGGVFRSIAGGSFTSLNNNLEISQGYRIGVLRNDFNHVCTGRQDNGTDVKGGATQTFKRALGGDGMECFFNSTGTRWYGESQNGGWEGCAYNTSTGATSNCTSLSPPGSGAWDTPWGASATNPGTLYGSRTGFIKSTDNGSTWTTLSPGGTGSFRNFVVEANGTSDAILLIQGSGLRKSLDGGSTWESASGIGLPTASPIHVAIHPTNPQIMAVVYSGYTDNQKAYLTVNGGTSWTNISSGIPNVPADAVAFDGKTTNGPGIYVATDAGVYFKDDRFTTFQNFSDGLPNIRGAEIEVNPNPAGTEKRVTVSLYGRGVWQSPVWDNSVGIAKKSNLAFESFTIRYSPSSSRVYFTLGIQDLGSATTLSLTTLGGKTLHTEKIIHPGFLETSVDMSRYGKGVYLMVLKNAKGHFAKRFTVN